MLTYSGNFEEKLNIKLPSAYVLQIFFKQDCIPVGCVPQACCPYLPACTVLGGRLPLVLGGACLWSWGVPASGPVGVEGTCLWSQGGLPRGEPASGVGGVPASDPGVGGGDCGCVSQHAMRQTPPCEQNS